MVVFDQRLGLLILEVFSSLNDSMNTYSAQDSVKPIPMPPLTSGTLPFNSEETNLHFTLHLKNNTKCTQDHSHYQKADASLQSILSVLQSSLTKELTLPNLAQRGSLTA